MSQNGNFFEKKELRFFSSIRKYLLNEAFADNFEGIVESSEKSCIDRRHNLEAKSCPPSDSSRYKYRGFTKATLQRRENQEIGGVLVRECGRNWTL